MCRHTGDTQVTLVETITQVASQKLAYHLTARNDRHHDRSGRQRVTQPFRKMGNEMHHHRGHGQQGRCMAKTDQPKS